MNSKVERIRHRTKILNNLNTILSVLFIIIFVFIICFRPINKVCDIHNEVATVTDKNVKNNNNEGKYLIYCQDTDGNIKVYEITDSLLYGRFNSSDVYAQISIGKTYEFTVGGSRNGFMSWYPNIYEYKEVKE